MFNKYQLWEREITDLLIERMDIPNGDAQSIVERQRFIMAQEWTRGSSPSVVAERIIGLGVNPSASGVPST